MKRHREQVGYVYKASGVWYVRHHDNRIADEALVRTLAARRRHEKVRLPEIGELVRIQVSTCIGDVTEFSSKADARSEAKRLLERINETAHRPESVQSLASFAKQHFFPDHEKQVKPSTIAGYRARWRPTRALVW